MSEEGKTVSLTFRPTLDEELNTRAIGDATSINTLVVTVYEERADETLSKKFDIIKDWQEAKDKGVDLTLIEDHTYKILFWAQNIIDNTSYTITDDGKISVNYDDYINGGFSKMEQMDAFYGVSDVTVDLTPTKNKTITLTRPLAQLNFADNTTQPTSSTHSVEVTISNIPTSFNPFNDEVTTGGEVTFSFTDYFPSEPLVIDGSDYYYLSCNYLFVPTSNVSATLKLKHNSETVKELSIDNITLEKNKKTNVIGAIVQQPETWSVWDGIIPQECTLTTDSENHYIIDEAADIAWLSENGATLTSPSIFLQTKDIDMANKAITSIKLPTGSTYDGGGKTIKNFANSLFGDAMSLTVKDLAVENIVASGSTHIGTLVNTLQGSSSFANVFVLNSTVTTTNGAAGGFVGYISRKEMNNRSENLNVTFDNCHVAGTTIDGTTSEGHFVGLLRGYDNGETLTFNDNCTLTLPQAATVVSDFVSPYTEGNEGAWLATNDYSKFNGWLGNEECYRGKVFYGENRFVPCWDGKSKITPLTEGTTKLIYSAFDLASLQGTAAGNIKLMENVDMEYDIDGASKDGVRIHIFKALSTLTKLEGNGKTIYNITIRDNYYGGFVKSESCATTFENVTFDGADIRVTHDTSEGNAYVGTLRGFAYAETTINNVHVTNGYLNGVCKIGGLCGGIFSKITCSNSSVSNYSIENYDSHIISAGFKANGEIGGLIGYITVLDANTVNEISNCTVSDNNFNCVTYSASLWDRSVAPFIGDIRTQQAGTVRINNCKILGTNTYTNASNGKTASFDQHKKQTGGSWFRPTYTYYPLVGQCYAVIILDKNGKVYIDNTQIF